MTNKEMIESLPDENLYYLFDQICEEIDRLAWIRAELKTEIVHRELEQVKNNEEEGKVRRRYITND